MNGNCRPLSRILFLIPTETNRRRLETLPSLRRRLHRGSLEVLYNSLNEAGRKVHRGGETAFISRQARTDERMRIHTCPVQTAPVSLSNISRSKGLMSFTWLLYLFKGYRTECTLCPSAHCKVGKGHRGGMAIPSREEWQFTLSFAIWPVLSFC